MLITLAAAAGMLMAGCSSRSAASSPARPIQNLSFESAWAEAQKQPRDVQAQIDLARSAWKEYPNVAMRALQNALRIEPGSAQASSMLADLFRQHGYTDRQLETLEARLKRRPDDASALVNAAPIELSLGQTALATEMFGRAIRSAPYDPAVVKAVTLFYYDQKQPDRAIRILQSYLVHQPGDAGFWNILSESERSAGRYSDAEASVRQAIKLLPKDGAFHRQLAHILVSSGVAGRLPEAEREARLALRLGDKSIDTQYWLAVVLDHESRIPEAIAAYAAVAKRDASYESTAYRLGVLYQQNGRAVEGKRLVQLYAVMDRNRMKLDQAVSDVSRQANRPESYSRLASIYQKVGSYGLAIALLRRAIKRFPHDAAFIGQLKAALLSAGRRTEGTEV